MELAQYADGEPLPAAAIVNKEFNEVAGHLPWHWPKCRKLICNPGTDPRSRRRLEFEWQSCDPAHSPWQQNFSRLCLPSTGPILFGSTAGGMLLGPLWADGVHSDMMYIAERRAFKGTIERQALIVCHSINGWQGSSRQSGMLTTS